MAKERQQGQLDATARYAIKLAPEEVLRWLVPALTPDLTFSRWLDTEMIAFPGEPRRRCDTVARLLGREQPMPPWALAVEVEARPRAAIEGRLAEYLLRLFRKMRYGEQKDPYLVAGALIVLTGKQRKLKREMKLPDALLTMGWHLEVMNLAEQDARRTLERIGAGALGMGVLPWVPLMIGADAKVVAEEWARLATLEADVERRRDFGGLAQVFAGHLEREEVWNRVLEGWQMEDSKVIKGYVDRAMEDSKVIKGYVDRAMEDSKVIKGYVDRAVDKAVREALVKARRDDVIQMIEMKFHVAPPADLVTQIQQNTSIDSLIAWKNDAFRADSLDAFRMAITPAPEKRTDP